MRADWIKLMIAAARFPLRSDPANNPFERPSAHGRIKFSIWLLSSRFFLTYSPAIFVGHLPRLPFDFIQPANRVQCLFGQLAFVRRVQIEELAAGVGHVADFGDALLEVCLVAGEIVAHQLAIPLAKEVACMLARTARA